LPVSDRPEVQNNAYSLHGDTEAHEKNEPAASAVGSS